MSVNDKPRPGQLWRYKFETHTQREYVIMVMPVVFVTPADLPCRDDVFVRSALDIGMTLCQCVVDRRSVSPGYEPCDTNMFWDNLDDRYWELISDV